MCQEKLSKVRNSFHCYRIAEFFLRGLKFCHFQDSPIREIFTLKMFSPYGTKLILNEITEYPSAKFPRYTVITSIKAFWFMRLLLEAHTRDSPIAVPSCVVTVTKYSLETGRLALRRTIADPLSSDTLHTTGSKLTVISTQNEEKGSKESTLGLDLCPLEGIMHA